MEKRGRHIHVLLSVVRYSIGQPPYLCPTLHGPHVLGGAEQLVVHQPAPVLFRDDRRGRHAAGDARRLGARAQHRLRRQRVGFHGAAELVEPDRADHQAAAGQQDQHRADDGDGGVVGDDAQAVEKVLRLGVDNGRAHADRVGALLEAEADLVGGAGLEVGHGVRAHLEADLDVAELDGRGGLAPVRLDLEARNFFTI